MTENELSVIPAVLGVVGVIIFGFWLKGTGGHQDQITEEIWNAKDQEDQPKAEGIFFAAAARLLLIGIVGVAILFALMIPALEGVAVK